MIFYIVFSFFSPWSFTWPFFFLAWFSFIIPSLFPRAQSSILSISPTPPSHYLNAFLLESLFTRSTLDLSFFKHAKLLSHWDVTSALSSVDPQFPSSHLSLLGYPFKKIFWQSTSSSNSLEKVCGQWNVWILACFYSFLTFDIGFFFLLKKNIGDNFEGTTSSSSRMHEAPSRNLNTILMIHIPF